jgi:hypothetical protein
VPSTKQYCMMGCFSISRGSSQARRRQVGLRSDRCGRDCLPQFSCAYSAAALKIRRGGVNEKGAGPTFIRDY